MRIFVSGGNSTYRRAGDIKHLICFFKEIKNFTALRSDNKPALSYKSFTEYV